MGWYEIRKSQKLFDSINWFRLFHFEVEIGEMTIRSESQGAEIQTFHLSEAIVLKFPLFFSTDHWVAPFSFQTPQLYREMY